MKTVNRFCIALLAVMLVSLVGCTSQKFQEVGQPITMGSKTYAALLVERVNPWGTNVADTHLVEIPNDEVAAQQSFQAPYPTVQAVSMPVAPAPEYPVYQGDPQQPRYRAQASGQTASSQQPYYIQTAQKPPAGVGLQATQQTPQPQYMHVPQQLPFVHVPVQRSETRIVNSNNQGCAGIVPSAAAGVSNAVLGTAGNCIIAGKNRGNVNVNNSSSSAATATGTGTATSN